MLNDMIRFDSIENLNSKPDQSILSWTLALHNVGLTLNVLAVGKHAILHIHGLIATA